MCNQQFHTVVLHSGCGNFPQLESERREREQKGGGEEKEKEGEERMEGDEEVGATLVSRERRQSAAVLERQGLTL